MGKSEGDPTRILGSDPPPLGVPSEKFKKSLTPADPADPKIKKTFQLFRFTPWDSSTQKYKKYCVFEKGPPAKGGVEERERER